MQNSIFWSVKSLFVPVLCFSFVTLPALKWNQKPQKWELRICYNWGNMAGPCTVPNTTPAGWFNFIHSTWWVIQSCSSFILYKQYFCWSVLKEVKFSHISFSVFYLRLGRALSFPPRVDLKICNDIKIQQSWDQFWENIFLV